MIPSLDLKTEFDEAVVVINLGVVVVGTGGGEVVEILTVVGGVVVDDVGDVNDVYDLAVVGGRVSLGRGWGTVTGRGLLRRFKTLLNFLGGFWTTGAVKESRAS